jgi:hypothetical protein
MEFKKEKKRKKKNTTMISILWFVFLCWFLLYFLVCHQEEKEEENFLLIYTGKQTEQGGFFWVMYNILHVLHFAEQHHMQVHIDLDDGLYKDTCFGNQDWFSNYFSSLVHPQAKEWMTAKKEKNLIDWERKKEKRSGGVFRWDEGSFQRRDIRTINYQQLWKKYFRLQPRVTQRLEELKNRLEWKSATCRIGVHYRGTDKYANQTQHEDFPEHPEFCFFEQWLSKEIHQQVTKYESTPTFCIFLCSDEQPFIVHMKTYLATTFPQVHILESCSIRAAISTNGLHLTSMQDCGADWNGPEYQKNPVCQQYKRLASESIHRGMTHESNYKKGEDVLIDVLLLSECDIFYHSHGNVSNFPKLLNPQLETHDTVQLYGQTKRHPTITIPQRQVKRLA